MAIEIGSSFQFAIKKQSNAWGGVPLALGASDAFEANSETLKAAVELIRNQGLFGAAYQRPGSPGKSMVDGDVVADLYYQDAFWRAICGVMGPVSDVVTGGGPNYTHTIDMKNNHAGLLFTLIANASQGVQEWGCVKPSAFKINIDQSKMRAAATVSFVCQDENYNVGSPITNNIVATAAAANGAKTIAAQPTTPSPITLTLTGVTELVTTIVYVNMRGDTVTEVHTRSTGGLTYVTLQYAKSVTSITCASIGGAGNFSAGVSNGVNNATTVASLTYATQRDCANFAQMHFYINDATGADFIAANDEQFLESIEFGVSLNMDKRVTTEFGYRISEPSTGGAGWPLATCGFKFSAFTDKNRRHLYDQFGKGQLKAKLVLTGPLVPATSIPNSITIYMNGLQLTDGDIDAGGPGVLPFDLKGECHAVTAVPTGFPGGLLQPAQIVLVNALSTAILA